MPELHNDFFQLSPDLLVILDSQGRIVEGNTAWHESLSGRSQESTGNSFFDFVHPADVEAVSLYLKSHSFDEGAGPKEFSLRQSTKSEEYFLVNWIFCMSPQTKLFYGSGRKGDSGSKISFENNMLIKILDGVPAMIGYWDRDLRNKFANKAYYEYFLVKPQEIRGKHIREVIGEKLFAANVGYMEKALAGEFQTFEREIPLPQGGSRATLANYIPDIEGGQIVGFFVVVTDVSKMKRIESELLQAFNALELEKSRFSLLVEALDLTAMVEIADSTGAITYANEKFVEVSGYSKEELLGHSHHKLNSGFHPPEFFAELWQTILEGKPWHGEICNRKKNGVLYWVDTIIVPIPDARGKVGQFIAIRFDITMRREAEKTLIESSKMASLGIMAAGVAHEINNPLAIIKGKVETLQRKLADVNFSRTSIQEELEKIGQTSDRIGSVVRGLRSFARSGEKDPFSLVQASDLVSQTLALCKERFSKHGVEIRVEVRADLTFMCRPGQIIQVLINLLNNSFDALEKLEEKWVSIDVRETVAGKIRFAVLDSGQGIPPKLAEQVMSPFFTTKEIGKGTGLGLSISRGIIEDHGGHLWLDQESKNTKFVFEIPMFHNEVGQRNI
ncbi:PAS domain-containing sensor histidine kinase [Bdellovibrio svalbardensis]|uniref:histidine kinase n=1 Tax=Bdellovibrio svalbardensis TaxID=2972972 RepID=A0ABT6DM33_9BACT|nr:PAS domain-containing sensor histidine kinase [Bdellovibrio svalbardensis]MDG0817659.1 PAS domain-containing protein [Bdellovibrio svalbardensis]